MNMISKGKRAFGGRIAKVKEAGLILHLTASYVDEDVAAGTTIGTFSVVGGVGPFTYAIDADPENKFQIGGVGSDELQLKTGQSFNYETDISHTVTIEITDTGDSNALYYKTKVIFINNVADGPTTTGAASDLDTELGAPTVGFATTFDARDVIISPIGQALTFTVSHGSVDVDGFTVNWTPVDTDVSAGATVFTLTAEDEDGQILAVDSTSFGVEVSITPPSFNAADYVEGDSVTVTSGSATGATSSATYLLLNGVDVTGDIVGGVYTVPAISVDATLTLNFYAYYDGVEYFETASAILYAIPAEIVTTVQFDVLEDTDNPTLSSTSPADNATGVGTGIAPTLTFSEAVYFGTGNIVLRENNGGWADLEAFDVATEVGSSAGQVEISSDTLTIHPTSALTGGREYAIRVASTAIEDFAGNAFAGIADDTTFSFTTSGGDVTAPTLSSPVDAANGQTAATGSVDTDEGNGTLYWVVSTSGTAPSAAQVKAGQDHTGSAAADSGSQAVSGTGTQTLSPAPSGLTASTAYTIHFMHEDAAANQSSVASGDGFTTTSAGISAPELLGTYVGTSNITQAETSSFITTDTSVIYVEVTTTNNDSASVVIGYTDITIGDASRSYGTGTTISATARQQKFSGRQNIHVFELLTPAAATGQTVQVRWSNTSRSTVIKVWKVEGANRSAQTGATTTNSPNGNQTSTAISVTTNTAGSIVFYAGIRNYDAAAITVSGATELDQRTSGGTTAANDHHAWSAYEAAASTGSYDVTASWTGSISQAGVAIEVLAA